MVAWGYEIYLLVSVEISFVSPRGDVISSIYRPDSQGNLSLVIFSSPVSRKSQEGLEAANPVTRNLVTWTARAVLHAFSSSNKSVKYNV